MCIRDRLRATQILDMTEKAQHEVMSLEGGMSGTINLGIVEGRAPFLTARWIAGFKEEFPNVKYSMWNGSSDDVLDRLRQGLVDLAVIAAPYDTEHLEGITVGRGPWVAIMSRSNELADLDGDTIPVSYTHLDVYKRQYLHRAAEVSALALAV